MGKVLLLSICLSLFSVKLSSEASWSKPSDQKGTIFALPQNTTHLEDSSDLAQAAVTHLS